MQLKYFILIFLPLALYCNRTAAADSLMSRFPSAILVQLRSEQSRAKTLTARHLYKDLAYLQTDARGVASAMMADFSDHFTYCPVYYFYDTNINAVVNRQFANVLLDSSGHPAKNIVIGDSSIDYLIVFFGYPVVQAREQKVVDDPKEQVVNSDATGKALVINNYKDQQVSFIFMLQIEGALTGTRKFGRYAYHSKRFDMEYFPMALRLNEALEKAAKVGDNSLYIRHKAPAPNIDSLR